MLAKRKLSRINWFSTSFAAQLEFINDPAKLKAAICTRRAGKSTGVGELALKNAHENPGVSIGIIGKTRDSVKKIYFKDVIKPTCSRIGWVEGKDYWINKTELSVELANGSMIYFAGADANEDEMNKFLGQKYFLVVIDEASMYANIDLKELVHEILEPAVSDYEGTIIMIGTPSNYVGSYYHKVTSGADEAKIWSVHKWTWADNPHVVKQINALLERRRSINPDIVNDAGYKQHWLGEWQVELSARVYKYNENLNTPVTLPAGYQYVLGVDLGYEDDTAFVVGAWSHYDTALHIVHCESETHLDLDQVEARIKRLQSVYNIGIITVDGAGKQFVETLQNRFQVALHRAEKVQKKDFIELMNTDFLMRRINVFHNNCLPLVKEWESLVWDEDARKKGEWKEQRNKPNHAADAALYMWRWCYAYAHIPKIAPPTEEDVIEQKHTARIESQNNDHQDIIFDSEFDFGF